MRSECYLPSGTGPRKKGERATCPLPFYSPGAMLYSPLCRPVMRTAIVAAAPTRMPRAIGVRGPPAAMYADRTCVGSAGSPACSLPWSLAAPDGGLPWAPACLVGVTVAVEVAVEVEVAVPLAVAVDVAVAVRVGVDVAAFGVDVAAFGVDVAEFGVAVAVPAGLEVAVAVGVEASGVPVEVAVAVGVAIAVAVAVTVAVGVDVSSAAAGNGVDVGVGVVEPLAGVPGFPECGQSSSPVTSSTMSPWLSCAGTAFSLTEMYTYRPEPV